MKNNTKNILAYLIPYLPRTIIFLTLVINIITRHWPYWFTFSDDFLYIDFFSDVDLLLWWFLLFSSLELFENLDMSKFGSSMVFWRAWKGHSRNWICVLHGEIFFKKRNWFWPSWTMEIVFHVYISCWVESKYLQSGNIVYLIVRIYLELIWKI